MAFTNFDTKEIHCKILYFGPAGAGKSTNLRSLYSLMSSEIQSGMFSLEEPVVDPPLFEFIPLSIGYVKDYHLKLHIYTMPVNDIYESLKSTVLKGIDGYVFVCDSRIEALWENAQSLKRVKRDLMEDGHDLGGIPRVIQYNKRDLKDIASLNILRSEFNPTNHPDIETVALEAKGTRETLQLITQQILMQLGTTTSSRSEESYHGTTK